jgi:hypothetical protein
MAASNEVAVRFVASLEGLTTGLAQARAAIDSFSAGVKSSIEGLASPFKKLNEAIVAIGAIAAGGYIFKSFIDATVDATLETMKLSKAMGISMDAASVWRTELKTVGLPVEEFTDLVMKLDRQVRTNSETFQKAGVATKDANGNLLSQTEIVNNAIAALGKYKEGTDRNIAAQTMFGRNVGNTTALLRLTGEAAQRAAKDTAELHLFATDEDKAKVIAYKIALNEMMLAFEGIRNAIGTQLLPYLTAFANWFRSVAPTLITNMQGTVDSAIQSIIGWIGKVGDLFIQLKGFIVGATSSIAGFEARIQAVDLGDIAKFMLFLGENPAAKIAAAGAQTAEGLKAQREALEAERKEWDKTVAAWRKTLTDLAANPPKGPAEPPRGTKSATDLIKGGADKTSKVAAELDEEIRVLQRNEELKRALYDQDVAMYGMSQNAKFEAFAKLENDTYQGEFALLQRKKALYGQDTEEQKRVQGQIEELTARHNTKLVQLNTQSFEAMKAKWSEMLDTITSSFNGQLRGLLAGTTRFKDAFKTILGDMVIAMIQAVEKMVASWLAGELAKKTAFLTTQTEMVAAQATATATSMTETIAKALKAIASSVGQVIAGVTAFLSPVLGPAAVPAGIAAGAATEGAAVAAMAESGWWNVPKISPTLLHAGEMVVPKPFADDLREQGGGFGGGTTHLHFPGIMDSNAFLMAAKNNASPLARMIAKAMTQNPSLRPAY